MGRRGPMSDKDKARLSRMLDEKYTYKDMASIMGVCTDTLKRILVREGLAEFDGAKYAVSPLHKTRMKTWKRNCLKCRKENTLPKWQYICDRCKSNNEAYNIDDEFIYHDASVSRE